MRLGQLGGKAEIVLINIKNAEASASIANGTPVAFVYNGTDDGLAVVLPATAAGTKATSLFAGICEMPGGTTLIVGAIGKAIANGLALSVKITQTTRAATTDSWSTFAAIATGDIFTVDTVNNAMQRQTAGVVTGFLPFAIAGQSLGSGSGTASATSDTRTVQTGTIKMHIRAM